MNEILTYINYAAHVIEAGGVVVIISGLLYSLGFFLWSVWRKKENNYVALRRNIGKSILLGLEILIAADIITTIVTEPDMNSVTILAIIVFIRIILSFSLQVEVEGKFPWQQKK